MNGICRSSLRGLVVGFWVLMITCSVSFAQGSAKIKVVGPCMQCADHLLSTVKGIAGVGTAKYDPSTSILDVSYGAATSVLDISLELSIAGYDAGDFKRDANAKMPACCASSMRGDEDALGELTDEEELGDWEDLENLDDLDGLSSSISIDDLLEDDEEEEDFEPIEDEDVAGFDIEESDDDDN